MPTIVREAGFSIRIYGPPREHGPPHVHVLKEDREVVVRLGAEGEPAAVIRRYRMTWRDMADAFRLVEKHQVKLEQVWRALHDMADPD